MPRHPLRARWAEWAPHLGRIHGRRTRRDRDQARTPGQTCRSRGHERSDHPALRPTQRGARCRSLSCPTLSRVASSENFARSNTASYQSTRSTRHCARLPPRRVASTFVPTARELRLNLFRSRSIRGRVRIGRRNAHSMSRPDTSPGSARPCFIVIMKSAVARSATVILLGSAVVVSIPSSLNDAAFAELIVSAGVIPALSEFRQSRRRAPRVRAWR
jgi:hypothetical protein